nr:MAG TPA: hypothetical protein [Caudoviricetes sp.]
MSLKLSIVHVLIFFGIESKPKECLNYVQAVTDYAHLD